jgi:hypothetical protein
LESKSQIIVFIHFHAWFRYTRRPHFSAFSKIGNVLIVEDPLSIFSKKFLLNPISEILYYIKYSRGRRIDRSNDCIIIRPILLFTEKLKVNYYLLRKIDLLLLKLYLNDYYKRNYCQNIIFITDLKQEWLINIKNNSDKILLDLNDEWSMIGYDEIKRPIIEKKLRNIIDKVDLVITVTKKLVDKYQKNNKCIFFPNAVDTQFFIPEFIKSKVKYEKSVSELYGDSKYIQINKKEKYSYNMSLNIISEICSPIIGIISGISVVWTGYKFIKQVEEMLPLEYSLISTGLIHKPTKADYLEDYIRYCEGPRTIFLGHLDYSILPLFLSKINIGAVLYQMNEFNLHSAPNKIWAYLAMGLPVVSTDFLDNNDKEIYGGYVKFSRTPEEFVQNIINEYKNDSEKLRLQRRKFAERNSTYIRAEKIYYLINK